MTCPTGLRYSPHAMLRYTAHPARAHPRRAAVAAGLIALVAWLAGAAGGKAIGALAIAVLLLSLAPFLFPTCYALDGDGVAARRLGVTRRRRWTELRSFRAGRDAVWLSPYTGPSWLDRTRGLLVFFGDQRDAVMALVKEKVRC